MNEEKSARISPGETLQRQEKNAVERRAKGKIGAPRESAPFEVAESVISTTTED